jgi:hypothetical protein
MGSILASYSGWPRFKSRSVEWQFWPRFIFAGYRTIWHYGLLTDPVILFLIHLTTQAVVRFLFLLLWGRVRLSLFATSATDWPIVPTERLVEWELASETEVLGGNLTQCHFVHNKSHMTRDRTLAAAMGSRWLTTWAVVRPRCQREREKRNVNVIAVTRRGVP